MTIPPVDLPPLSVPGFQNLSEDKKALFVSEFNHRKRSMALMVALSILFPIQLFFLGKVGLGILFLLTGGGFGFWFVVEWFLTPGRVRDYNTKTANQIIASLGTPGV
ncbi:MAG: TM2 domain-containing protein [Actinomycetota bacterium]|nr:TM2 domain-containing protein [Actinomycetota bacterium]